MKRHPSFVLGTRWRLLVRKLVFILFYISGTKKKTVVAVAAKRTRPRRGGEGQKQKKGERKNRLFSLDEGGEGRKN